MPKPNQTQTQTQAGMESWAPTLAPARLGAAHSTAPARAHTEELSLANPALCPGPHQDSSARAAAAAGHSSGFLNPPEMTETHWGLPLSDPPGAI